MVIIHAILAVVNSIVTEISKILIEICRKKNKAFI